MSHRRLVAIALSGLSCLVIVACAPSTWDEARAAANDDAIYRVVLDSTMREMIPTGTGEVQPLVAVTDKTVAVDQKVLESLARRANLPDPMLPKGPDPLFGDRLSTTERRRLASSLRDRNRESHPIAFQAAIKVVFVIPVTLADFEQPRTFRTYDDSYEFSRPGYTGRYAAVEMAHHCGLLCGSGRIVLLQLRRDGWHIVEDSVLWMS